MRRSDREHVSAGLDDDGLGTAARVGFFPSFLSLSYAPLNSHPKNCRGKPKNAEITWRFFLPKFALFLSCRGNAVVFRRLLTPERRRIHCKNRDLIRRARKSEFFHDSASSTLTIFNPHCDLNSVQLQLSPSAVAILLGLAGAGREPVLMDRDLAGRRAASRLSFAPSLFLSFLFYTSTLFFLMKKFPNADEHARFLSSML